MNYYLKVLQNYATFSGRARRNEYWYFALFNFIFVIVAMLIDNVLGTTFKMNYGISLPFGYVYLLYLLFIIIPSVAVSIRRLHDIGKSGIYLLITLIPLIGGIWFLVLLFTDGDPGENQYGSNPKNNATI